jgi:Dynamin family
MGPSANPNFRPPGAPGRGAGLVAIARLADEAGAPSIASEARELAARLEEGRVFLACVGQHKRGKSSLLNALVGAPLLPAGVVPLTSVVTVVRHGPDRRARIRMADHSWRDVDPSEIRSYVTEEGNPGNVKGVVGAEVFDPHPLLASGLCLVDTPGIGSVFERNTATTRDLVPHIDAAIAVLGVDPPISGDELALAADMARHVRRMIFVINKADRIPEHELEQARAFTERVVSGRLGYPPMRIPRVSATERLAGASGGDWDALVRDVTAIATESGAELLAGAASRGLARAAAALVRELTERRDALSRPLEESERRLERLRSSVQDAERAMGDLRPLVRAEHERLASKLRGLGDAFVGATLPEARDELARRLRARTGLRPAVLRRGAFGDARAIARARLDPLRVEVAEAGQAAYAAATERFALIAVSFLRGLSAPVETAPAALPDEVGFDLALRVPSRVYYTEMLPMASPSPQRWLLELVLPAGLARRSIERRVQRYLSALLATNAARIVNDLEDRARESARRLQAEIRRRVGATAASAQRALDAAREQIAHGRESVAAEIGRVDRLIGEAAAIGGIAASRRESSGGR